MPPRLVPAPAGVIGVSVGKLRHRAPKQLGPPVSAGTSNKTQALGPGYTGRDLVKRFRESLAELGSETAGGLCFERWPSPSSHPQGSCFAFPRQISPGHSPNHSPRPQQEAQGRSAEMWLARTWHGWAAQRPRGWLLASRPACPGCSAEAQGEGAAQVAGAQGQGLGTEHTAAGDVACCRRQAGNAGAQPRAARRLFCPCRAGRLAPLLPGNSPPWLWAHRIPDSASPCCPRWATGGGRDPTTQR